MRVILAGIILLMAGGCAQAPRDTGPAGSWGFAHREVVEDVESGEMAGHEASAIYNRVTAKCSIEADKIPVPGPSCTQGQKQDCSGMTGFARGFCQGYSPQPDCDYTATNAARDARQRVFDNCMQLEDWEKFWVPEGESLIPIAKAEWATREPADADPERSDNPGTDDQEIQEAIESIPELHQWQMNDEAKWRLAVSIDDHLRGQPEYSDVSLRERFLEVVERVNRATE